MILLDIRRLKNRWTAASRNLMRSRSFFVHADDEDGFVLDQDSSAESKLLADLSRRYN